MNWYSADVRFGPGTGMCVIKFHCIVITATIAIMVFESNYINWNWQEDKFSRLRCAPDETLCKSNRIVDHVILMLRNLSQAVIEFLFLSYHLRSVNGDSNQALNVISWNLRKFHFQWRTCNNWADCHSQWMAPEPGQMQLIWPDFCAWATYFRVKNMHLKFGVKICRKNHHQTEYTSRRVSLVENPNRKMEATNSFHVWVLILRKKKLCMPFSYFNETE